MKRCLFFALLSFSFTVYGKHPDSLRIKSADSLLLLSANASRQVDLKETIRLASEAQRISKEIKYTKGIVQAAYYIGQTLFHTGNYHESLDQLILAEKTKGAEQFPNYLSHIHKNKGQIYTSLELIPQAVKEFNTSIYYAEKVEPAYYNDFLRSQVYEHMGEMYRKTGANDSVIKYLDKSKVLLENLDLKYTHPHLINTYGSLGRYYNDINNTEMATLFLQKAKSLIDTFQYAYSSRTYRFLGDVMFTKELYEEAIHNYKHAVENIDATGIESELPELYELMSNAFIKINKPDSAHFYEMQKVKAENKLSNAKINTTKDVLQILVSEKQHEMKKLTERRMYILLVIVLLAGLSLMRVLWWVHHSKLKKEQQKEKAKLEKKLRHVYEEVLMMAKNNDPAFNQRFEDLFPEFSTALRTNYPFLSPSEFNLCAMTYLDIPTKDIAAYTFIEYRSVQTKRSRLRKKLNIESDVDLYDFLKSLDTPQMKN